MFSRFALNLSRNPRPTFSFQSLGRTKTSSALIQKSYRLFSSSQRVYHSSVSRKAFSPSENGHKQEDFEKKQKQEHTSLVQERNVIEDKKRNNYKADLEKWKEQEIKPWILSVSFAFFERIIGQKPDSEEVAMNVMERAVDQFIPQLNKNMIKTVGELITMQSSEAILLGIPLGWFKILLQTSEEQQKAIKEQNEKNELAEIPLFKNLKELRLTNKTEEQADYCLKDSEIDEDLQTEFKEYYKFMTTDFYGQQEKKLRAVTAKLYITVLRLVLGWIKNNKQFSGKLTLHSILPNSSRESARVLYDYVLWLEQDRKASTSHRLNVIKGCLKLAKFLFHNESKIDPQEGEKPYSDLPIVKELRKLRIMTFKKAINDLKYANEELKWLDWNDYLRCVEQARMLADTTHNKKGQEIPLPVRAMSYQKFLLLALLAFVPDRSRTFRELEIGRTLLKKGEQWWIKHGPEDYKTGGTYGDRPPILIHPSLNQHLENFIENWRPKLSPSHKFLFTQQSGKPPGKDFIRTLFTSIIFRLTGKKTNPHLVRDMIVTHLRQSNATEKELEALAMYMGHSLSMQKSTYDHRTKAQKIAPAVELINNLNKSLLK
eukprot:TRINITY_DN3696_c0_g1_i1.p1 TRINITY_DN3696_c0_g1~~TRINITY_DN3696_c0_g1_i1.p1  ORF type:complete len:601 (-),score=105.46 TRINITY_DN3696_c0_g1_i1:640-2442(-)